MLPGTQSEPVFVLATQELAERYYGQRPPYGFRGYAALLDGEPIALGGLYRDGLLLLAFTEMKEPMRRFRKARARAVRLMVDLMDSVHVPVYAIVSETEPTSSALLAKLGFEQTGLETENGELVVRR